MRIGTPTLLQPRLEIRGAASHASVVNTTGDLLDVSNSLMIPKSQANFEYGADGQQFLLVTRVNEDGVEQQARIPRTAFQESPGPDGVFYLPTYKDSVSSGALRGALRGMFSLSRFGVMEGLMGGVSGAAGGALGSLVPVDSRPLKLLAGAAGGAATLAATQALLGGSTGLPVTLMVGAVTGLSGALGGCGEGKVRDALTGGMLTGMGVALLTGNPLITATSGVAAALGGHARTPAVQVATAAVAGGVLGAAQALITHNPVGISVGLTAAAGALGAALGAPLMQVSRNLSDSGSRQISQHLKGWLSRQSDATTTVVGGIPGAIGGALLGSAAAALNPSWLVPGACAGAIVGGAVGLVQTHQLIAEARKS